MTFFLKEWKISILIVSLNHKTVENTFICKDENQLNVPAEPGVFLLQTISLVSIVKNNIIMGDRDDKMIKYIVF